MAPEWWSKHGGPSAIEKHIFTSGCHEYQAAGTGGFSKEQRSDICRSRTACSATWCPPFSHCCAAAKAAIIHSTAARYGNRFLKGSRLPEPSSNRCRATIVARFGNRRQCCPRAGSHADDPAVSPETRAEFANLERQPRRVIKPDAPAKRAAHCAVSKES